MQSCASASVRTSSFVFFSLQDRFIIFRYAHISNDCNFVIFLVVIVHVSHPYKSVDHTYAFIIRFLVFIVVCRAVIDFNIELNAPLAISILFKISSSLFPCDVIVCPKYVYLSVCLMISPSIFTLTLVEVRSLETNIVLVFFAFIFMSNVFPMRFTSFNISCRSSSVSASRTVSSAYRKLIIVVPSIFVPLLVLIAPKMFYVNRLNRQGDNTQPTVVLLSWCEFPVTTRLLFSCMLFDSNTDFLSSLCLSHRCLFSMHSIIFACLILSKAF